jgi:glyoxylase-like metal-dependent hydrolase (beta-lactamase superfamily II)
MISRFLILRGFATAFALSVGLATSTSATPMKTQVYNPGKNGIFPASSVLVTGDKDALLIDAQFSTVDAAKLVDLVRASGKRLTTIFISCGDPDFYFGLEVLKAAFPDAAIVATKPVVQHIKDSYVKKLQYWAPILGAGAPKQAIIPEVLAENTLRLEGESLQIIGVDGPLPDRTFVWIPSIKTVVGSVPVFGDMHIFLADTNTPTAHAAWLSTLDQILALHPTVVVPGHFAPGAPQTVESVKFTANYIKVFDEEAARAKNSEELIAAMQRRFPKLELNESLKISARVAQGEMKW